MNTHKKAGFVVLKLAIGYNKLLDIISGEDGLNEQERRFLANRLETLGNVIEELDTWRQTYNENDAVTLKEYLQKDLH